MGDFSRHCGGYCGSGVWLQNASDNEENHVLVLAMRVIADCQLIGKALVHC